ncbi:filamentous hemagglutinin N-terminal domain-containing protein [Pelagibacteraceae bacterium]|nr:filamentous hemagglutinin N-terminal domain-containing protein [Pelagibacteraceae bacterium]
MRVFITLIITIFYSCFVLAELPDGNATIAGDITITSNDQLMTIQQQSDQAIIEWNSFNIGENNTVTFNQPSSSSSALNRVVSGNPTTLAGSLNANGKVYVVNENGVYFTPTSTINAHSFAASTLALSNDNFLNNIFSFTSSNQSSLQSIINKGSITTLDGGFTALLGGAIDNEGTINANLGKVGLGAGKEMTLDLSGDKFLQVAVPIDAATTLLDHEGDTLHTLISHSGSTKGNTIELDVGTAKNILSNAINIPGSLIANKAEQQKGKIILSGSGTIKIDGSLKAPSTGDINITSDTLSLGGTIDVSDDLPGSITITSKGELSVSGSILADSQNNTGGTIELTSPSIMQMDKSLISANGTNGGSIALSGNTIISSGTLSSNGSTAKGGRIDIEGTNSIRLLSSDITASGSQQGGLVRIGGAFQGGYDLTRTDEQEETFVTRWGNVPTMENVNTLFINDGSTLNIESDQTPGTLILWSDQETTMLGHINAMGLQGGSVEISSKDTLRYLGLQNINMVEGGHLLLDPKNIIISDTAGSQSWSLQGVIGFDYTGSKDYDLNSSEGSLGGTIVYSDTTTRIGSSVALSGNGKNLAIASVQIPTHCGWGCPRQTGRILLFTFDDTDFSNATLRGQLYNGASGSNDLDTSGIYMRNVALDQDGDRLVYSFDAIRTNSVINDYTVGTTLSIPGVRTVKFDDTNFSNPQHVGIIGTRFSSFDIPLTSNDLDMYAGESEFYGSWGHHVDVALNADGSRLALTYQDFTMERSFQQREGINLISFSDTNFSSPSFTGRIGVGNTGFRQGIDLTGSHSLDIGYDAPIENNRIMSRRSGYYFGWDIELSNDAKKLVVLHNFANCANSYANASSVCTTGDYYPSQNAIHLFTFADSNFLTPTYVGAITSENDSSVTCQATQNCLSGNSGFLYNNSKILPETFDWGHVISGGYVHASSYTTYWTEKVHHVTIALSGDGTRLAVSGRGSDDSRLHLIGFSDSSFGNPEIKQTITPNGTFKSKISGSNDIYHYQYAGGAMSMDDTGKLLVIGTPQDSGYNNSNTGYGGGATLLLKENILSGGYSYTDSSSDDVIINTTELKNLLDANVNVTLQANSDITVNSAITTTGTGTLSLHAGRDVDINKSISTSGNLAIIASDTSSNNVVSAQRDSGTGDILAAYESDGTTAISLTASDLDITLNNGSGVTNASMGDIELATITATTGTLQSANFSGSGAAVSDKIYDGDTSATVATTGSVSGLTLVGSDLSLVNTASFTSATVGSAKDATVDYDLSGYLSGNIDASNTSGTAITESVTADITSASSSNDSTETENNDSSETENIVAENTNDPSQLNVENMIGDVNKIIAFVSVDAIVGSTMSLQLATESTIRSISPTEELGIQSL